MSTYDKQGSTLEVGEQLLIPATLSGFELDGMVRVKIEPDPSWNGARAAEFSVHSRQVQKAPQAPTAAKGDSADILPGEEADAKPGSKAAGGFVATPGGRAYNADGSLAKPGETAVAKAEATTEATETETAEADGLDDLDFTTASTRDFARENNLTAKDFKRRKGSSASGAYNKGDVQDIVDAKIE